MDVVGIDPILFITGVPDVRLRQKSILTDAGGHAITKL